jgi:hypothetical protein
MLKDPRERRRSGSHCFFPEHNVGYNFISFLECIAIRNAFKHVQEIQRPSPEYKEEATFTYPK